MDFLEVIYENVEKNISQQTYLYPGDNKEFNSVVGSHVNITLSCELCSWGVCEAGWRGDAVSPPYFPVYYYFAIYIILLYILFLKTIIFFPKFNFQWYGN